MLEAEYRRRLAAARFLQVTAWSHAVTIRISAIAEGQEVSWNTATGVLIQLGGRRVVATAWHVVEKFVELRAKGQDTALVIGNHPTLAPCFVYRDDHNDLVFLDVPSEAGDDLGAVPYLADGRWPPRQVVVGDDVLVCGFPAMFRTDSGDIEHGDLTFVGEVESVSASQFILLPFERETMDLGRVPFPGSDSFLGGLSGAPAFALERGGLNLVGIFSQGGSTVPAWIVRSLANLPL